MTPAEEARARGASWNARDPWEGRTCGECRHLKRCRLIGGIKLVCAIDPDFLAEVDPEEWACESYEAKE